MKWFNNAKPEPDRQVCQECYVVFDPRHNERFNNFCTRCAAPLIEKQDRIAVVVAWASENWEVLESLALEDQKKKKLPDAEVRDKRVVELMRQQQNAYSAYQSTFELWNRKY